MLRNTPIKRKLTLVMMLISTVVVILTSAAFTAYEVYSVQTNMRQNAQTIAQITAANSTAALAFGDEKTAAEILSNLEAKANIIMAALYTRDGKILARYPETMPLNAFPPRPEPDGSVFERSALRTFLRVQQDGHIVGDIFIKTGMAPVYERFRLYAEIVFLVMLGSVVVALLLSHWLQRQISRPVLELADTARAIAINKDYLVRAKKYGQDELGLLTDAFNRMLTEIHDGEVALRENEERLRVALKTSQAATEEVRTLNAQLEERVLHRTAELAASNQELEAFTYSVSHDLRAPLRHIDGYAQILQEEPTVVISPVATRQLARIRQGVQNMGHLVDDLLNLSRVGREELRWADIHLDDLVAEVLAELKPETENRNIQWRIGKLPTVRADAGLMKQVFTNLLSNSIKYTRPRPTAIIEIGQVKTRDATAVFVRDNGVGFDMKYSNKLFGVFERLHRAEDFEGTGVGLATVHRIIRIHQGQIWAEAELDKGAAFYFTLKGMQ